MESPSPELDPFRLSAELEKAASRLAAFKRGLSTGSAQSHPFGVSEFPGLSTYRQVSRLHLSDPLREPLLRAIVRLTDERVNIPWAVQDAQLEFVEKHVIHQPSEELVTLAEIRRRAFMGKEWERGPYFKTLGLLESRLSAHRVGRLARSLEVSARLGVDLSAFYNPVASSDEEGESKKIGHFAQRILQKTQDQAENFIQPGWSAFVDAAVAREAGEGWPARLAPDSLRQLLSAKELFRGVVIDPGELPLRHFPMSFPRAAAQVGQALSRALAPRDLPAVVSHDLEDLRGHQIGQLFLLWTMSAPFLRRKLGLSRTHVDSSVRALTCALLAHARLSAARLLLLEEAVLGSEALRAQFCELSISLVGEELPANSALARFRVRGDERARFAGLLSALDAFRELRETYNDDWFDNPRAQEDLRSRLMLPPFVRTEPSRLEAGMSELEGLLKNGL